MWQCGNVNVNTYCVHVKLTCPCGAGYQLMPHPMPLTAVVFHTWHAVAWQVDGWGQLLTCAMTAEVIGPRLRISETDSVAGGVCSAIVFGTVPVLQVCDKLRCNLRAVDHLACKVTLLGVILVFELVMARDTNAQEHMAFEGNTVQNESGPKGKRLCDAQNHTRTLHLRNDSDISACVSFTLENTDAPFLVSLQSATLAPHGRLELQARVCPSVLVDMSLPFC